MAKNERKPLWEDKRTPEQFLGGEFDRVEAYRFNSASIHVRVIDHRFEGKSIAEREDLVLPLLKKLPKRTQEDILWLLTVAPSELQGFNRHTVFNHEFEHPLPSRL